MILEDWLEDNAGERLSALRERWWFRMLEPAARWFGWPTLALAPIGLGCLILSWVIAYWSWAGIPESENGMGHGRAWGQLLWLQWPLIFGAGIAAVNGLVLIVFCWIGVRRDDKPWLLIGSRMLGGVYLIGVSFGTLWGLIAAWD